MKSGLFFPNHFVRIALQSLEEVIGPGGMTTIYSHSSLAHLAEALPPDDMNKQFDFTDFAALFETLQSIFGSRGSRSLAMRAGRITFTRGLTIFGKGSITEPQPGTGPLGPHSVLIRLNRLSNFFNTVSDQRSTVAATDIPNTFIYTVQVCPNCMDRSSSEPVCAFYEGLLSEAAKTFSGGLEYSTRELQCMAGGAEACIFEIKLD
ncbi:MAG: 4-vinyl reductase [Anaerolineaceae bacterium]|jgi:predicted hydrocarbon binding protein|nr:4-vinyl reductase [Anaerolineaceae bacterium]